MRLHADSQLAAVVRRLQQASVSVHVHMHRRDPFIERSLSLHLIGSGPLSEAPFLSETKQSINEDART